MHSRRAFLGRGLAAAALGLSAQRTFGWRLLGGAGCGGGLGADASGPILDIGDGGPSVMIDGLRFAQDWSGDWPDEMLHPPVRLVDNAPAPGEVVDVVVVGGGISGLTSAYLLRDRFPVLLEHQRRAGGAAQAERWNGWPYSLGGAYVITPDKGSFLESFYAELGLDKMHRLSEGNDAPELRGAFDEEFWTRRLATGEMLAGFAPYARAVGHYVENYPEIPLPEDGDNDWILDLDTRTLKQDVERWLGAPAPELLSSAVQAYCYSSFGAGWEEISAAGGWNFIAAEEFGRWVFPGGNGALADALWRRLADTERASGRCMLRAGCRAMDVRLGKGFADVVYEDASGELRTIRARKVVMACPKYVCKHIIRDLRKIDEPKLDAMHELHYRPYVVANLLLKAPIGRDFYDAFLLGDGVYPHSDGEAQGFSRVTDVLNGSFAQDPKGGPPVLTLYWPLCWGTGRFTLVPVAKPFETYTAAIIPQIDRILGLFGLGRKDVEQVRLTRWGHAMPVCTPRLIVDGVVDKLRRPLDDTIYFVQQDNWALPAVENSVLDAQRYTDEIRAGL